MSAVRLVIEGRVQGVGFRAWVEREAEAQGLKGYVRNLDSGAVEAVFAGEAVAVEAMVTACGRGPRLAAVTKVLRFPASEEGWRDFAVR
ncbi:MAG: acylphosphatase [Rhizobiales bacterium]|nr:acylphosphatase [Hyphomicrobiales bacterium]MBI3674018.1 acylphosphatase [Hyphomicrobiales bacterium]